MNGKLVFLDLFCGAGGASVGLHRAFPDARIIGVDRVHQPHYPFEFVQGDALCPPFELSGFDFIWASPMCQKFVRLQHVNSARGVVNNHVSQISEIRALLQGAGVAFVIENVEGVLSGSQLTLCGHALGLEKLMRHRCFESNRMLVGPRCSHRRASGKIVGVYGSKPDGHRVSVKRYALTRVASSIDEARAVMGIDWMDWNEITQAVPPAYSEFLIRQILR